MTEHTNHSTADDTLESNVAMLRTVLRRFGWLYKLRPQSIVEPLYRLVGPPGGRAIISVAGAKAYVDPFTTSGWTIVKDGGYEPQLTQLIHARLPRGGCFFDIGANEGIFSGIAAHVAGENGLVIAVEPQSRLRDILEIHLALNSRGNYQIYRNAIGERDGDRLTLSLGPSSHTGGSSLVRRYRWSWRTEVVTSRTVDSILAENGNPRVDLMKVDVEGFEREVVYSAKLTLAARRVAVLAIDYHSSILANRGFDPRTIDDVIRGYGYRLESGSPDGGCCVYHG